MRLPSPAFVIDHSKAGCGGGQNAPMRCAATSRACPAAILETSGGLGPDLADERRARRDERVARADRGIGQRRDLPYDLLPLDLLKAHADARTRGGRALRRHDIDVRRPDLLEHRRGQRIELPVVVHVCELGAIARADPGPIDAMEAGVVEIVVDRRPDLVEQRRIIRRRRGARTQPRSRQSGRPSVLLHRILPGSQFGCGKAPVWMQSLLDQY